MIYGITPTYESTPLSLAFRIDVRGLDSYAESGFGRTSPNLICHAEAKTEAKNRSVNVRVKETPKENGDG